MKTRESIRLAENKRIPVTVSSPSISRADFRDKALKAYFKNRRKRNLENLNLIRGSNLLSESSDEECEPNEIFLENAWNEYQSFFMKQPEDDFDLDQCIEQYFSDNIFVNLGSTHLTEAYCSLQEEELDDLLVKIEIMDISDSSRATINCPVCSLSILGFREEYYSCSSCNIKAKSHTFSDYCTTKASHRQNCTSPVSLVKGLTGYSLVCSKCGDISSVEFLEV